MTLFLGLALGLWGGFPARGEAGREEKRILVLETTDMHGWLVNASSWREETYQYRLAFLAHEIEELRSSGEYDDVILLDGGDIYQGSLASNCNHGAVMRAALDVMGYDAVALGNHELMWEISETCDEEGTVAPYEIGPFSGDPDIPVLASNIYDGMTRRRAAFTRDYCILKKAGLRIAVVGYVPDFRLSLPKEARLRYIIRDDLDQLSKLLTRVREQEKPDALILLAHGRPKPIARALKKGEADLVLGGHTHVTALGTVKKGTAYLQADACCRGYASAVLVIGEDGVRVEDLSLRDISLEEALYEKEESLPYLDEIILALSKEGLKTVPEEMGEVLGYITTPVIREKAGRSNTAGNWISGLCLRGTRQQGAVAAFVKNGGNRYSFLIPLGEDRRNITVGDIYTIAPDGYRLLLFDITGPELAQQLIDGLHDPSYGDQLSGLTYTYRILKDGSRLDREIEILSITLDDGTEVDLTDEETLYRVCTTNYSAEIPGSVFEGKEPVVPPEEAPVDREVYIALLREEAAANGGFLFVDEGQRGTLEGEEKEGFYWNEQEYWEE